MKIATTLIEEINASAPVEKTIQQLILESLVPQGVDIPKPDVVFGVNGVPVFTKKSISTLIGKAKAGKTTVTSWIVSQAINEEVSVLWVDTEQGLYYCSRTQYWTLKMADKESSEYLQFYDLKIFGPTERISMIEEIIKMFRPSLLIIDGIRDLVFDINSPDEATKRVGDLMRWADVYDLHILSILHQNKGNDHARGHLGTEMINKSESVLKVEQNEEKLIVCSPEYTRAAPFEAFAFSRDQYGMPYIVERGAGEIQVSSGQDNKVRKGPDPWDPAFDNVYPEMVDYVFSKKEFLSYREFYERIQDYFRDNGSSIGIVKAKDFVRRLNGIGITWENEHIKSREKYHKNPKYAFLKIEMPPNLNPEGLLSAKKNDDDYVPF